MRKKALLVALFAVLLVLVPIGPAQAHGNPCYAVALQPVLYSKNGNIKIMWGGAFHCFANHPAYDLYMSLYRFNRDTGQGKFLQERFPTCIGTGDSCPSSGYYWYHYDVNDNPRYKFWFSSYISGCALNQYGQCISAHFANDYSPVTAWP